MNTIDPHVATQTTGLSGSLTLYDDAGRSTGSERLSGIALTIDADDTTYQATVTANLSAAVTVSSSTTHYNSLGQVDYTISETGARTDYVYDSAGRQYQTIETGVPVYNPGTGLTVDTDLTTTTVFDGLGRAYQTIDALNHTTTTVYDDQGRVSRTVYDDGSFVAYGYDSLGRKIWQSDQLAAQGQNESDQDFADRIAASRTDWVYNDAGQLTDVKLPAIVDNNSSSSTYGQSVRPTWHYTYDQYGQQLSQTDPYGHITSFTYESLTGLRTGRTLPAVGGTTVSESWTYDSFGRMKSHTDFDGQTTVFSYDSLGRASGEALFATGKDPEVDGADETIEYHYDAMGNRDQVTIRNASDEITRQEDYGYDSQNRLTSISVPEGEGAIYYAYNDLGQQTDVWSDSTTAATASTWTQYGYDALGRLQTVTAKRLLGQDQNEVTSYAYDGVGDLTLVLQPNDVRTTYTFDTLNRLDLETVTNGSGTLASYVYHLLPDGNRDYVIETDASSNETKVSWTYDADGRLTAETRDEGNDSIQNGGDYTDTYTLDLVGNQLQKTHDAVGTTNDESADKGPGLSAGQTGKE